MGYWKVINMGGMVFRRSMLLIMGLTTIVNIDTTASMAVSMLVSLAVYAFAFGWKFAVGFIFLLFIHEIGHLLASRIVGLRASGPMFVPFIGAVINLNRPPVNAKMEANIAIGGPAVGTLSALVCLTLYLWTDSMLMLALAYTACLLNLFNLIPCMPLDGGRIAAAISPHVWWIGSLVLGVLFVCTYNIFILIIFLFSLLRLWHGDSIEQETNYYYLTTRQRISVAWWYFGLLAVLGFTTLYLIELF